MTEKKGGFLKAIKEFIYGMAAHDSARFALKTRAQMEHRRRQGRMRDAPFADQPLQLRIAALRRQENEGRARRQNRRDLRHRGIEAQRRELEDGAIRR